MKKELEIQNKLYELTDEYNDSNAFGQSVIGSILKELCWVLDLDYNDYHKRKLINKGRGHRGTGKRK